MSWEAALLVLEDDTTMVVELCLEQSKSTLLPTEGLALDFVFEPTRDEASVTQVRFRKETDARPDGLLDCLEGLLGEGPVPMEFFDGLENGIFTLRLGTNRPTAEN